MHKKGFMVEISQLLDALYNHYCNLIATDS